MTNLYFAPVSSKWKSHFERTVRNPLELDGDVLPENLSDLNEARVWGTTNEQKKLRYFEDMKPGDLVLFYSDGHVFASGRVAYKFRSDRFGDWAWDSPSSELVYTITNYEEVTIPFSEFRDLLGYSEGYVIRGFTRPAKHAISNLLQQYNSVEEAFQDLKNSDETEGDGRIEEVKEVEENNDVRTHTEIQWFLIQLGLKHNYDVFVAKNDRNATFEGHRLGEECVEKLSLAGFSDAAIGIIEYVDVIWLDGDHIVKMFEVESTTSVFSGILRMTDFVVKVPNLAVDMYIVASQSDEDKVRKEMNRPTFQHVLEPAKYCTLQYLSFDDVRERHDVVNQAGPLRTVF